MEDKMKLLWEQIREYRKLNMLTTSMDKELGVYDDGSRSTADLTLEAVQLYMEEIYPELGKTICETLD